MRPLLALFLALLVSSPAWADSHAEDDGSEEGGDSSEGDADEDEAPQEEGDSSEETEAAEPAADAPAEVESSEEPAAAGEDAPDTEDAPDASAAPKFKGLPDRVVIDLPHDIQLIPVARVQARVTLFDQDDPERNDPIVYGDPGLREGVSLRRARFGIEARWREMLSFRVVAGWDNRYDYTEAFSHNIRLTEAQFRLSPFDALGVTVGLTRVPFGRQATASSAHLALVERSLVSEHLSPDREVGVFLSGSFGAQENPVVSDNAFRWAFGISNGGGDWTGDADPSPRLAGRVSLDLGAAWDQAESGYELTGFGLSIGGSLAHNWGLEADSLSAGADLGIRFWRIGLQGEFMVSHAEPTFDTEGIPEQLAERTSMGGYGQLVFVILPGTLEVAARVGVYDDNTGLSDAGDRLDAGGGVNLYLFDGRLKTQLNFIHREELNEAHQTANDSLILQVQARL
ncbi:MAG: porin [Myxococcota bacterium]|nr:porin [Myxococcota bacterium]